MPKKRSKKFDGIPVRREVDDEGLITEFDKNDRVCWNSTEQERACLSKDLRRYGPELHAGQLGWTIPETSDGYKWVTVEFDTGDTLPILIWILDRIIPDRAGAFAAARIGRTRNSMFDADPVVAEHFRQEFIRKEYSPHVDCDHIEEIGEGSQEVYAFTFPSLKELAQLKGKEFFPMKIGYTADDFIGSIERVRGMMTEVAAFPERPRLLVVCKTNDGRKLELSVHRDLRQKNRKLAAAVGREWFLTSTEEIIAICLAPDAVAVKSVKLAPLERWEFATTRAWIWSNSDRMSRRGRWDSIGWSS